jgi:hypothetical protein
VQRYVGPTQSQPLFIFYHGHFWTETKYVETHLFSISPSTTQFISELGYLYCSKDYTAIQRCMLTLLRHLEACINLISKPLRN